MKKFLFSLAAFAIALTASAQDAGTAKVSAKVVTELYNNKTEMKAIILTISENTKKGWQSNFYPTEGGISVKKVEAMGDLLATVEDDMGDPINIFETDFNKTSNVDNTPVFLAKFKVAAQAYVEGKQPPVIKDGDICKAWYDLTATGIVKIVSVGANELMVDLEDITAANVVAADDAVSATKTVENGQVVIVKNGKKFTAAGAQMK